MTTRSSISPANNDQQREYVFKILVIGETTTGKTSIIDQYVNNHFSKYYKATIGVDFALKILKTNDGSIVRVQLWDIAGQERFGSMTRNYYKEAVGCIIVFDVTRGSTFEVVEKWKRDLDSKIQLPNGNDIPCILLGNKCDLPKDSSMYNADKMNKYCQEKGFAAWFETSAKENINIRKSIQYLINEIIKHTDSDDGSFITSRRIDNILLVSDSHSRTSSGCCGGKK